MKHLFTLGTLKSLDFFSLKNDRGPYNLKLLVNGLFSGFPHQGYEDLTILRSTRQSVKMSECQKCCNIAS